MTTRFILTVATLLASALAQAQDISPAHSPHEAHKDSYFIGGLTSFWYDTDTKAATFTIEPEAGYLFSENWGLGIRIVYEYEGAERLHTIGTSPFLRYYYYRKLPFNFYLDAGLGVSSVVHEQEKARYGFEAGIRPGACVDLTEGICLCLHFGFIGYRKGYVLGEEEGLGQSGAGFLLAPEDLRIGLELEF